MSSQALTPAQRDRQVAALQKAIEVVQSMPVIRPCEQCEHFDQGLCHVWKAQVPTEARAAGCDKWEEGIPF